MDGNSSEDSDENALQIDEEDQNSQTNSENDNSNKSPELACSDCGEVFSKKVLKKLHVCMRQNASKPQQNVPNPQRRSTRQKSGDSKNVDSNNEKTPMTKTRKKSGDSKNAVSNENSTTPMTKTRKKSGDSKNVDSKNDITPLAKSPELNQPLKKRILNQAEQFREERRKKYPKRFSQNENDSLITEENKNDSEIVTETTKSTEKEIPSVETPDKDTEVTEELKQPSNNKNINR